MFYSVQQKNFQKYRIHCCFCSVHSDALHMQMLIDISQPKGVFLKNKKKNFSLCIFDFRYLQDFGAFSCIVFIVYWKVI